MPAYFLHGFRWGRPSIRRFVERSGLPASKAEWLIGDHAGADVIMELMREYKYIPERSIPLPTEPGHNQAPEWQMRQESYILPEPHMSPDEDPRVNSHAWTGLKLMEEYDGRGTEQEPPRPYAFVANYVVRVDLDTSTEIEFYKFNRCPLSTSSAWLSRLRSALQPKEPVRWYIVNCAEGPKIPPSLTYDGGGADGRSDKSQASGQSGNDDDGADKKDDGDKKQDEDGDGNGNAESDRKEKRKALFNLIPLSGKKRADKNKQASGLWGRLEFVLIVFLVQDFP
ncbi:hypothetical protein GMORB2_5502 [Geosmithia morbida]|uniref:Uncharacterized protein n=1 Tax=Geosmithia morbida TaxID=1094350 RepID=A0A9P4YVC7_9HYPO|nr:uncharacterized protein GMORB2_5502 [Geosmithia morbida]KAF4123786.1 hypothetical protein GMORB2_5502 [Geosmithia morbida]